MGIRDIQTILQDEEEFPAVDVPFTPLETPPTKLLRGDSEMIFPTEIKTVLKDAEVEEHYDDEVEKAQKAVETLQLGTPDPTDD